MHQYSPVNEATPLKNLAARPIGCRTMLVLLGSHLGSAQPLLLPSLVSLHRTSFRQHTHPSPQLAPYAMLAMPNQQILCKICAQINLPDLKSAKGYVHAATCSVLVGSAKSCRLCKIIAKCLRRSIYHNRNINNPQRTLDDILTLGPVRMFAAGKDIESMSFPRRQAGRIEASQLARLVKISVGKVDAEDILLYDSRSAVLEMFADEGCLP